MDRLTEQVTSIAATTDDASSSGPPAPTTRSKLARAVVVLTIGAAVAYALSRYRRRSESIEAADAVEVVPVVDDAGGDRIDEAEAAAETGDSSDAGPTRETGDLEGETSVELTEDDRSPEEIVERSREDVPEPGEMTVDDGVAEELLEEADEVDEAERADDSGADGDADDGGDAAGDDSSAETDDERLE